MAQRSRGSSLTHYFKLPLGCQACYCLSHILPQRICEGTHGANVQFRAYLVMHAHSWYKVLLTPAPAPTLTFNPVSALHLPLQLILQTQDAGGGLLPSTSSWRASSPWTAALLPLPHTTAGARVGNKHPSPDPPTTYSLPPDLPSSVPAAPDSGPSSLGSTGGPGGHAGLMRRQLPWAVEAGLVTFAVVALSSGRTHGNHISVFASGWGTRVMALGGVGGGRCKGGGGVTRVGEASGGEGGEWEWGRGGMRGECK